MAFLVPQPIFNASTVSSSDALVCRKPRRLSSFIPSSFRQSTSPAWSNSLRASPLQPRVIRAPLLASASVANPPPPHILISGAPASGKGTQCEYIVNKYGVVHISTGDMLRAAVKNNTALGVEAKSYMDSGSLVPDDLVISMLKERIAEDDCAKKGWLLDGFPRTAVQAEALTEAKILPDAVIVLEVKDDVLLERVVGRRSDPQTGKIYHIKFSPPSDPEVLNRLTQRSDDTEEKARVRLESYYKHARSIADHYESTLRKIDGNRDKADVFSDIASIVDSSMTEKNDDDDDDITPSSPGVKSNTETKSNPDSTVGIPVAEFVRRAEEAYEKGVLTNEDVNWSGQAGVDTPGSSGTSNYSDLGKRLDLALGDTAAFLLFAYIGKASHGDKSLNFGVVQTATPFIVAWLATSPLLGAYTRAATANVAATVKTFAKSWAIAVPMGIGLRGVLTDHVPPAVFAVVTLVSTFAIVGGWRVLYTKIRGDETDEARRGGILDGFNMVSTLLRRW